MLVRRTLERCVVVATLSAEREVPGAGDDVEKAADDRRTFPSIYYNINNCDLCLKVINLIQLALSDIKLSSPETTVTPCRNIFTKREIAQHECL